ncbi:MAG: hypothetical protein ACK4WH_08690 [Phycisphaerales bacterium]
MNPSTFSTDLRSAQAEALACLIRLMRESESESQVRLAAAAILRLRPPDEPSPELPSAPILDAPRTPQDQRRADHPPGSNPSPAPPALSPGELAELARLLPNVAPSRFTSRHSPDHWRAVLREHIRLETAHAARAKPPPHANRRVA